MKKKFIIILIIILIFSVFVYKKFFGKKELDFDLAEIVIGNVIQEISETGQVKKGEALNLGFKSSGIIEDIYIETGEEVKRGDILAKIENSQLRIQLDEAKASLDLVQAQLNKLLIGASKEEIQIIQTAVDNAQTSFIAAEQNLEDIKMQGEENLKAAHEDSLNTLDDSYLKIFNALNAVDLVQVAHFNTNDQEGIKVRDNEDKIRDSLDQVKLYLDAAKSSQAYDDIDTALLEAENALDIIFDSLNIIRDVCEEPLYKDVVSSSEKTSLDTHRGYINTALTSIVNAKQTIISTKLTNTTNINIYQASLDSAQGQLKAAEDELTKIIASPRQEDVVLYQAQVRQAEAKIQLLEKQIADTIMKSPVDGQIVKINKRVGELVQSSLQDGLMTLFPAIPFGIEVDIYEEDVAKMRVGNLVEISLIAFPDEILKGKVITIDPADKMIDGVVYYEVSIDFEEHPSGVKPGMTADIIIKTALKENVLVVPDEAIQKKNGTAIVEILEGNNFKEKEIKIGLEGTNYLVEVLSGLKEGEQVVIR